MNIPRYAVVATRNRPHELKSLVNALSTQADGVFIVDNGSYPHVTVCEIASEVRKEFQVNVLYDFEQPPNLSRLWNYGINSLEADMRRAGIDAWDVAILNDDAVIPPHWFTKLSTHLRTSDQKPSAISGAMHVGVTSPLYKERPDNDPSTRLCPWAFIMVGELGFRADESLRWWWGDTDLDWQARRSGGVLIMPGFQVQNLHANKSTVGELAVQAGRDRDTFLRKWGSLPW